MSRTSDSNWPRPIRKKVPARSRCPNCFSWSPISTTSRTIPSASTRARWSASRPHGARSSRKRRNAVKPLGLFPLRTVLLPGAALRLHIFEDRYKAMIGGCIESGDPFGVLLDRRGAELGDELDPVDIGTTAHIAEVTPLPQGRLHIVTRGERRFRVERLVSKKPFWTAEVSYLEEPIGAGAAATLQAIAAERFTDYLQALLALFGRDLDSLHMPEDITASSYLIADALQVEGTVKQQLLEAATSIDRLRAEMVLLDSETERLRALAAEGVRVDEPSPETAPFNVRFSEN